MKDKSKKSTYSTTFGVDPINIAGIGALLRIYTHADCHFKNLREIRLLYKVF